MSTTPSVQRLGDETISRLPKWYAILLSLLDESVPERNEAEMPVAEA